ncbi:beta-ketoacyl synthase N-terminal-like domain-containing protein [Paenibacillus sonchi]|uniref:beta-ketoacyl synthase N-terminal-like domain-containing protein n=1 Tax=Paenibacillus sonchi TaxID=373687 RepID=UPI001E4B3D2A|nr:beta-ketoacyl synthase N-terminal-like domain-containing protein [Paenibacillus sonchi]
MENDLSLNSKIAVIGMAGRFPQAGDIGEFWHNLVQGAEGIQFFSKEELRQAGVNPALLEKPEYVPASGRLQDIGRFDAAFFQYTPREAEIMDPQQRLFLECAWTAIEDAGHSLSQYDGAVGVFAGVGANKYITHIMSHPELLQILDHRQIEVANDKDFLTTRVSYKLNATGPSFVVQTACSSSLVSVHIACQSLLNGECDMALAGGVSIQFLDKSGYLYKAGGIESPDGHCRCFDEKAEGTVFGDGVGVIVLKRLEEAIADKDHIYAVISGSAIGNDGAGKIGFTAPGFDGQVQVISEAMEVAGVTPHDIGYIEAHGTGTKLGDQVEIAALKEVFKSRAQEKACYIGSVKSSIGHLNTASGIAGLIKTVLVIQQNLIPPLLHLRSPNQQLELEDSPFRLNQSPVTWAAGGQKRVAGVSSFGIGGTNAHVIVEQAPDLRPEPGRQASYLLPFSGKTEQARQRNLDNLLAYLKANPEADPARVSYTLQTGREHFDYRGFLLCGNHGEQRIICPDQWAVKQEKSVVFLISLEQAPPVTMVRELYRQEPFFRQTMDESFHMVERMFQLDLTKRISPEADNVQGQAEFASSQEPYGPLLSFIFGYSLAQLWQHWGVFPQAVAGDWIGEYVGACLANVFAREDALKLLFLQGEVPEGMVMGQPAIPVLSNISQTWLEEGQATSLAYWKQALNQPSNLLACVSELAALQNPVFIKIGPGHHRPDRLDLTIQEKNQTALLLDSLPGEADNESVHMVLQGSLGRLWLKNVEVCWKNVQSGGQARKIPLPTYAFDRETYWIDRAAAGEQGSLEAGELHEEPAMVMNRGDHFVQIGSTGYTLDSSQLQQVQELIASFTPNSAVSFPDVPEKRKAYIVSRLCSILGELLGTQPVSSQDDFFEIGGDSVTAIQFASRAKDFDIVFASDLLFEYPTIEQLSDKILEQPMASLQEEKPVPEQRAGIHYFDVGTSDQDLLAEVLSAEEVESVYPLSFMQLLVLNHNIINARLGTVNLLSFQIFEELHRGRFQSAWNKVVNRHTLLRTGFVWRRISNPVQFVKKKAEITIHELDWTGLSQEGQQRALDEFLSLESKRSFKVDEVPQMRFHLMKLGEACYQFVWSYQNSLFDGWSMNIILREVWDSYEQSESRKLLPETAATPYLTYMQWQKTKDIGEAKQCWTEEMKDFSMETQPESADDMTSLNYEGAFQSADIPPGDLQAARDYARKGQITMNTLFLGVWGLVLARLLKKQDLMLGMITSGRVPEVEHMDTMVGLFTNSLPVRLTYAPAKRVLDWFQALQKKLLKLRRHEHVTLQQISQWSGLPVDYLQRVANTRSLVYTNFPYHVNQTQSGSGQNLLQAESIGQLQLPLRLFVNPGEERFTLRIEYNRSVYDHDHIANLLLDIRQQLAKIPRVSTLGELVHPEGEQKGHL